MTEAAAANGATKAEAEETGAAGAVPLPAGAFPDASIVRGRLRSFGRPDAERDAAFASGSAVAGPLLASGVLLATGPDAASFLHGQLANQVQTLTPGQAARSLVLNHKGHAMAEAMVLRDAADRFRLVVDDGGLAWTLRTLDDHRVFDQVDLSTAAEALLVTLQGDAAERVLRAVTTNVVPSEDTHVAARVARSEVTLWRRRRASAGGFDLLVPSAGVVAVLDALRGGGAELVGEDALDAAKVAAGLASAGGEAGEGVLPQEAGLEDALSYRKGCYLGQEIMARIEARGKLRRALTTVVLDGPVEPGTAAPEIRHADKVVGRLGTVARMPDGAYRALAVLRTDLPPAAELEAAGRAARRVG
jgi:tRNA-modifying protein YgfZ